MCIFILAWDYFDYCGFVISFDLNMWDFQFYYLWRLFWSSGIPWTWILEQIFLLKKKTFKRFLYLFERVTERGETEWQRSSTFWFTLKCSEKPGLGQSKTSSNELHLGFPCEWQELNTSAVSRCLQGILAGMWIGSRVARTWTRHSNLVCKHPRL